MSVRYLINGSVAISSILLISQVSFVATSYRVLLSVEECMDVLLNGLSISAKKELQSLCCMMRKRCHIDVTFWLLMFGD